MIRIIAPGEVTTQLSPLPPASSSATEVLGGSESRPATAQPPEPPPTTTKSNVSVTLSPPVVVMMMPCGSRHGEERSDEAIDTCFVAIWIASRSLSTGARIRDPLANDGLNHYDINRSIFSSRAIFPPYGG